MLLLLPFALLSFCLFHVAFTFLSSFCHSAPPHSLPLASPLHYTSSHSSPPELYCSTLFSHICTTFLSFPLRPHLLSMPHFTSRLAPKMYILDPETFSGPVRLQRPCRSPARRVANSSALKTMMAYAAALKGYNSSSAIAASAIAGDLPPRVSLTVPLCFLLKMFS